MAFAFWSSSSAICQLHELNVGAIGGVREIRHDGRLWLGGKTKRLGSGYKAFAEAVEPFSHSRAWFLLILAGLTSEPNTTDNTIPSHHISALNSAGIYVLPAFALLDLLPRTT
jgi:hypothetical protein